MHRNWNPTTALFTLTLGILLGISTPSFAQEPPEPGEEHKILAREVGSWVSQVEMMMPGLDEPIKSEGTEECVSICNGLFVHSTFSSEVLGMPFEGYIVMGFDTFKQKYTGVWVDNFGSSLYHMEGTYDDENNQLVVTMTGPDPATGDPISQRHVTTYVDDDTKTLEVFMADPSGASDRLVKILTVTSKRKE